MSQPSKNTLLWWAAGAFALLIAAWTAFFVIASRHRVEEVPVETRRAAP